MWSQVGLTKHCYEAGGGDEIPVELFQILKDDAVKVLCSICQQIWKIQQWPQDWERSVFIPVSKKDHAKECSNKCTIILISHNNKVVLKILQARLQQYMNWEHLDGQAGFRKGRGTRDQVVNICWLIEKTREFQKKHLLLLHWLCESLWLQITTNWKILKEMGVPDYLTCLRETCMQIKKQQNWTWNKWLVHNWDWVWQGYSIWQ